MTEADRQSRRGKEEERREGGRGEHVYVPRGAEGRWEDTKRM